MQGLCLDSGSALGDQFPHVRYTEHPMDLETFLKVDCHELFYMAFETGQAKDQ